MMIMIGLEKYFNRQFLLILICNIFKFQLFHSQVSLTLSCILPLIYLGCLAIFVIFAIAVVGTIPVVLLNFIIDFKPSVIQHYKLYLRSSPWSVLLWRSEQLWSNSDSRKSPVDSSSPEAMTLKKGKNNQQN